MSSIRSTQNRQTFLRRKYCFLVAIALSPPVGRCDALMGRPPPLVSAMIVSSYSLSVPDPAVTGAAGTGAPGIGAPGVGPAAEPPAMICSAVGILGAATGGAGR